MNFFISFHQSYTPVTMNESNDKSAEDDNSISPARSLDFIPSARNLNLDIKLNEHQMIEGNDNDQPSDENEYVVLDANKPIDEKDVNLFAANTTNGGNSFFFIFDHISKNHKQLH